MAVRQAVISPDGTYRYQLLRRWQKGSSVVAFVMLNPSTADAEVDDPTIRRCIGFARAWGHDAMVVVNLFGYRATQPSELTGAGDPVGPDNDRHIKVATAQAERIICAWGAHPLASERLEAVRALLPAEVECLGLTASGQPRHPLYLPAAVRPHRFNPVIPKDVYPSSQ